MTAQDTTISAENAAKVKEVVCEVLEVEEDEVTDTSLFIEDHEADSLRAIEILASLEKAFGVAIDQSELPRMVNLRGVNQVMAETAGW